DAFDHWVGLVPQELLVAGEFVALPEERGDAAHAGEEVRAVAEDSRALGGLDEHAVDVAAEAEEVIPAVEAVLGLDVVEKFLRRLRIRLARQEQILEFL